MSGDLLDELTRRSPADKPRRPDSDMCLFMQGVRKCHRIFRSLGQRRIGVSEAKRRLRRNYQRTGAYMGPVGWADG